MIDLVRLGRLTFRDFLALDPLTLRRVAADAESRADLETVLSNQPDVLRRFRSAIGPIRPVGSAQPAAAAAQARLVRRWAFELLRERAPALWDALPYYDWDTSIVTGRFPAWKTRFLLAGEPSASCLAAFRRTAGIWCVEPLATIREYLSRKAELLRVKRCLVLDAGLERIPLADRAADLAIVGPCLTEPELAELVRVSRTVLVLNLRPGAAGPDDNWLSDQGFEPGGVGTRAGARPCWWRQAADPEAEVHHKDSKSQRA